jgi:putative spermidine/putrescine transport system permease protein
MISLTQDTPELLETAAITAGPRGRRRRDRSVDPISWWLAVVGIAVAVYFTLPTLVVIPMSFGGQGSFQFPPKEFTFELYRNFFTNPKWIGSLLNSLLVAVLAAMIATTVGCCSRRVASDRRPSWRSGRSTGRSLAAVSWPASSWCSP